MNIRTLLNLFQHALLVITFIILTGCTSTATRVFSKPICQGFLCSGKLYYPYQGTLTNLYMVSLCGLDFCGDTLLENSALTIYGISDTAFSFTLDTILVPLDIYHTAFNK